MDFVSINFQGFLSTLFLTYFLIKFHTNYKHVNIIEILKFKILLIHLTIFKFQRNNKFVKFFEKMINIYTKFV